jgi:hypothetical protein
MRYLIVAGVVIIILGFLSVTYLGVIGEQKTEIDARDKRIKGLVTKYETLKTDRDHWKRKHHKLERDLKRSVVVPVVTTSRANMNRLPQSIGTNEPVRKQVDTLLAPATAPSKP